MCVMLCGWCHWQGIYSVSMEYHFEQTKNVVTATSPDLVVNLTGHGPVGGMDVDWLGGNVFWTLPGEARIDYMAVDGMGHRVFKSGLAGLTRLAVDSENRCVGVELWCGGGGGPFTRTVLCCYATGQCSGFSGRSPGKRCGGVCLMTVVVLRCCTG